MFPEEAKKNRMPLSGSIILGFFFLNDASTHRQQQQTNVKDFVFPAAAALSLVYTESCRTKCCLYLGENPENNYNSKGSGA